MHEGIKFITSLRLFFVAMVFVTATAIAYLSWDEFTLKSAKLKYDGEKILHLEHHEQPKKKILVLYWGYPWGMKSYVPAEGPLEDSCMVTHQRSRLKEVDAIVFHYTVISKRNMPWKFYRNPEQIYIWWSAENPAIIKLDHNDGNAFDNFFNWTKTYRRDSDVAGSYGYRHKVINELPRGKKVVDDIIASKKKLAIWFVSQCSYTNGARLRIAYAEELRKAGIDFDGYGKCFPNAKKVPKDSPQMPNAIKEHKFYFSFENGLHCKDYITEKFWYYGLGLGTVPIVWGPTKEDILAVAPLDSFIYAEDYESPAKLAEYLKFLDSNDTEYRKYFRWREDENMTDEKMINMTRERYPEVDVKEERKSLCQELTDNKKRKTIVSLDKFFMTSNPKECAG